MQNVYFVLSISAGHYEKLAYLKQAYFPAANKCRKHDQNMRE